MCQVADSALRKMRVTPYATENSMSLDNVTPGPRPPMSST